MHTNRTRLIVPVQICLSFLLCCRDSPQYYQERLKLRSEVFGWWYKSRKLALQRSLSSSRLWRAQSSPCDTTCSARTPQVKLRLRKAGGSTFGHMEEPRSLITKLLRPWTLFLCTHITHRCLIVTSTASETSHTHQESRKTWEWMNLVKGRVTEK